MRSRKTDSRRIALGALVMVFALVAAACGGSGDDAGEAETTVVTAPADDAVKSLTDVRGAVIRIEAEGTFDYPGEGTQYNEGSSGSGFFISPDGIAVTNNHVVTGAAFLQVYVEGEDEPRNAKILGVSECSDLAVIDVDGDGFPYLAWYPDELEVGVDVFAAGFPLGDHEYTLLDGIISKEDANGETSWASVDSVIEHTADILPGNSGGPLVSEDGLVVGVNYAGDTEGQAFAIGYEEAGKVLPILQSGQDVTSIGINGSALLTDDGSGIWVYSVGSGSPADLVGVRGGDIVSEIEGLIPATDGTMSDYCESYAARNPTRPFRSRFGVMPTAAISRARSTRRRHSPPSAGQHLVDRPPRRRRLPLRRPRLPPTPAGVRSLSGSASKMCRSRTSSMVSITRPHRATLPTTTRCTT